MWLDDIAKKYGLEVELGAYNSVAGVAVFNEAHTERFILEKRWARGERIFVAFLLSPSKASASQSDRTVTQMIELAKKHRCDALRVVNLSPVIDEDEARLKPETVRKSAINEAFIQAALNDATIIFLGWGAQGQAIIEAELANDSSLRYVFQQQQDKLYAYDVIEPKKNEVAYFPLPRMKGQYKKYVEATARKLSDLTDKTFY